MRALALALLLVACGETDWPRAIYPSIGATDEQREVVQRVVRRWNQLSEEELGRHIVLYDNGDVTVWINPDIEWPCDSPSDPACAEIDGYNVYIRWNEYAEDYLTHEVGHILGLYDRDDGAGVMSRSGGLVFDALDRANLRALAQSQSG